MLKWIRALVEHYTHAEEAGRRVAAGFRLCIDCAHHRGGIRDIPYYCAVCTTSNSVTGASKHITCESARVFADQCGPSGKRWKARRGLISCQG